MSMKTKSTPPHHPKKKKNSKSTPSQCKEDFKQLKNFQPAAEEKNCTSGFYWASSLECFHFSQIARYVCEVWAPFNMKGSSVSPHVQVGSGSSHHWGILMHPWCSRAGMGLPRTGDSGVGASGLWDVIVTAFCVCEGFRSSLTTCTWLKAQSWIVCAEKQVQKTLWCGLACV